MGTPDKNKKRPNRPQRWVPFFYSGVLALFVGYLALLFLLRPPADLHGVLFCTNPGAACQNALQSSADQIPGWDLNGDDKIVLSLQPLAFSAPFENLDAGRQDAAAELLGKSENALLFCNENALAYLNARGQLSLWSEICSDPAVTNGPVALNLAALPEFSADPAFGEPLYLCLRAPSEDYAYTRQAERLIPYLVEHAPRN